MGSRPVVGCGQPQCKVACVLKLVRVSSLSICRIQVASRYNYYSCISKLSTVGMASIQVVLLFIMCLVFRWSYIR